MPGIDFEILIDESMSKIASSADLDKLINKRVLSFVNDFEDKKWCTEQFESFIWDNIADTALSERERRSLSNKSRSTLLSAAKNLRLTDRDKTGKGSEIAEEFLYGVMKNHFGALPVVPKIFYKQNTNDNAKGADSVHIVVNGDDFSLWFGEAKFYNSIEDARLGSIVTSAFDCLASDKLKKERSIITSVSDLDEIAIDSNLRDKIKKSLRSNSSIDHLKGRLHVPTLILHECKKTFSCIEMSEEYKKYIENYHIEQANSYFQKQISKPKLIHKYESINFHIILFPVPKKADLVASFLNEVKFYKGKD